MTTTTDREQSRRIGAALDRLHAALAGRPGFGHAATTTVSTLGDGLRCTTTDRSHSIASDMAPAFGGEATAPSPFSLMRSALGACLAIGYRMHAADCGVELTAVRVTVESESELSGMVDVESGVPPGFTALRYHVEIESPAPADEIERVVERADRLSPVLDAVTRAHTVPRTVTISHPEA